MESINELLEIVEGFINTNSVLTQITGFIAASPLLKILFNVYTNREPGLKYKIKSVSLLDHLSQQYPKLSFTYAKKSLDKLILIKIIIFNKSKKTIIKTDINNKKGVEINVQGKILEASITGEVSSGCEFAIKKKQKSKDEFVLAFEYMKHKNAVLIEMLLDNSASSSFKEPDLTASGSKLKGITKNQSFGSGNYIPLVYMILMLCIFFIGTASFLVSERWAELAVKHDISNTELIWGMSVAMPLIVLIITISVSAVDSFLFKQKWISDLIKKFDQEIISKSKEEVSEEDADENLYEKILHSIAHKLSKFAVRR